MAFEQRYDEILAKLRLKPPSNWRAASFLPFVVYHNNHEYSI
jgi:hypothetical protein